MIRPALVLAATLACTVAAEERAGGPASAAPDQEKQAAGAKPGTTFPAEATAYSVEGKTADGTPAREGVVAADPDVLPLGSRIRVQGAGEHSGEYVVEDTGPAVQGREIDVYLPNDREAKEFGRKDVQVEVLERGKGRDGTPEPAPGPEGR